MNLQAWCQTVASLQSKDRNLRYDSDACIGKLGLYRGNGCFSSFPLFIPLAFLRTSLDFWLLHPHKGPVQMPWLPSLCRNLPESLSEQPNHQPTLPYLFSRGSSLMYQVTRENKNLSSSVGLLVTPFAYEVANEYKVAFSVLMKNSAVWIPLAFNAICVLMLLWGLKTENGPWHQMTGADLSTANGTFPSMCPTMPAPHRAPHSTALVCSFPLTKTSSYVQHIMKGRSISLLTQSHSSVPISALPALSSIWLSPITPAAFRTAQEESKFNLQIGNGITAPSGTLFSLWS